MAAHADPASVNKLSFSLDTFQFRASKVDKAYGRARYKKLYKVVHLFRVVEISLVLIFIWRNAANYFPLGIEYFHEGLMILSSPRTIFLIGNVIILALFAAASRQNLSSSHDDLFKPSTDLVCIHSHAHAADEQTKHVDGDDYRKLKIYRRSKSEMVSREPKLEELRRSTGSYMKLICVHLVPQHNRAMFWR